MASLFKTNIPKPKVVRMPTEDDPEVRQAGKRAQAAVASRQGRRSTILTSSGSSGEKLGA